MLNKKPWLYLAAAAVILLLLKYSDDLLGGIRLFASLLTPLVVGCGIAYVLNIPITRLEALPPLRNPDSRLYPVRRALSIIGSLVIIILVLVLLVLIIIPQLWTPSASCWWAFPRPSTVFWPGWIPWTSPCPSWNPGCAPST